jgi:glyoxylase-like metal-dependent hydrolase (beta-lactamase superfamily II)
LTQIAEILPGVLHWMAPHPKNRFIVHSYYVEDAATVLDPTAPDDVIDMLRRRRRPERVLLTNRHHYRQSDRLTDEFGCPVLCPESGLHEFEGGPTVQGYAYGTEVGPGITAHEVGSICPDDAALHIDSGPGMLAFADGVVRSNAALGFVPDFLMDDPARTKRGILESVRRLLELEFDALAFAHGEPLPAGGKRALREFAASPRTASF